MDLDYYELIEQRKILYLKLLDCSRRQLDYLDDVEQDAENDLTYFLEIQCSWNECKRDLDELDSMLQNANISTATTDDEWLLETVREIEGNVEKVMTGLEMNVRQTSISLQNVNNQRKVLNAYYGLQRNDQVPLYLDEKK